MEREIQKKEPLRIEQEILDQHNRMREFQETKLNLLAKIVIDLSMPVMSSKHMDGDMMIIVSEELAERIRKLREGEEACLVDKG